MNPLRRLSLLSLLVAPLTTHAADVTWTGADLTWSQPDANSFNAAYASGDNVTFGNTGVGAVTLSGALTPGNLVFTHTSGTYSFAFVSGNTIASTGDLSLSGGGTVQFGNLTNLPTAFNLLYTWTGSTSISGGSTLAITRPTTLGGSGSTLAIDNGTLRMGADNSATSTLNNNVSVGSGGAVITGTYGSNATNFAFSGTFTGGSAARLVLQTTPSAGSFINNGINITGTSNSGYLGAVELSTPTGSVATSITTFASASSLFTGASQVSVRNGGVLGVEFAVTDANLANVQVGTRGGIGARGANGSLVNLTNVSSFIGEGGNLILDNNVALNSNRLNDSATVSLNSGRFVITGRNATNLATNEVIQTLGFTGGSLLVLDEANNNSSGVDLTVTSLAGTGTAGNSLLIQTDAGDFGSGASLATVIVTGSGTSKPSVTNGMISASVQQYDGSNFIGNFVTFSGDDMISAAANYTNYAGDWATATSSQIVNVTAASTLSGAGTLDVYALRLTGGNVTHNLGGRTINIGSGGLIRDRSTISNGTLNFGSTHGYIGAYDAANQGTISATLAGTAGITFLGASQSVDLSGANTFTGGLWINGGNVTLNTATAANGNNVTVNSFGRLMTAVSTTSGAVIGGLSGVGRVAADFQGNSSSTGYLAITPVSGTHTFQGILSNGEAGRVLHLLKEGSGTQVFGADSTGTYTGGTAINAGTLLVNGNFAAATGAVTVSQNGRLGGTGVMGGALTTAGPLSRIAPGASAGRLTLNSSANFAAGSTFEFELGSVATAGTTYDQLAVGGLLTGSTNALDLNFEFTALSGFQTGVAYTIMTFGSVSGLDYSDLDATILPGGYQLDTSFGTGGWLITGNNLQVQFAVPEPTSALLAAMGLTVVLTLRRRTRA